MVRPGRDRDVSGRTGTDRAVRLAARGRRDRCRPALRRPRGTRSQDAGPPGRRCPRAHPARPAASVQGRRHRHRDLGQPVEPDLDPTDPGRQRWVGGDHRGRLVRSSQHRRPAAERAADALRRSAAHVGGHQPRSAAAATLAEVARASTGPLARGRSLAPAPTTARSANGGLEAWSRPAPPVTDQIVHSRVVKVAPATTRCNRRRKTCSPGPYRNISVVPSGDRRGVRWPGQLGGSDGHRDLTGGGDRHLPERSQGGQGHVDGGGRPGQRGKGDLQQRGVPDPEPTVGRREWGAHAPQPVRGTRQRSIQAAAARVEKGDEQAARRSAGTGPGPDPPGRDRPGRRFGAASGVTDQSSTVAPLIRRTACTAIRTWTARPSALVQIRLGQHRQLGIRGRRRRRWHGGRQRPSAVGGRPAQQRQAPRRRRCIRPAAARRRPDPARTAPRAARDASSPALPARVRRPAG